MWAGRSSPGIDQDGHDHRGDSGDGTHRTPENPEPENEFAHPEQGRNWLAITVAATNPDHPAHEFFVARRERMRSHLSSRRFGTDADGEELSADDKVTMLMAMIDGLRIQALMEPDHDVLPLLEIFMRLIATPADAG